jgi:hypothetical protein
LAFVEVVILFEPVDEGGNDGRYVIHTEFLCRCQLGESARQHTVSSLRRQCGCAQSSAYSTPSKRGGRFGLHCAQPSYPPNPLARRDVPFTYARAFSGRALREHRSPVPRFRSSLHPPASGKWPDCPLLRASDEHCFIVRVLRARRTTWSVPSYPSETALYRHSWVSRLHSHLPKAAPPGSKNPCRWFPAAAATRKFLGPFRSVPPPSVIASPVL